MGRSTGLEVEVSYTEPPRDRSTRRLNAYCGGRRLAFAAESEPAIGPGLLAAALADASQRGDALVLVAVPESLAAAAARPGRVAQLAAAPLRPPQH
jgi:hypothetical protein